MYIIIIMLIPINDLIFTNSLSAMMASDGGSRLYEKYIDKLRPLGIKIRLMETLKVLVHRFFCMLLAF